MELWNPNLLGYMQVAALRRILTQGLRQTSGSTGTFLARGSKPSAEEAQRSGKRGYCTAFNGALPVLQRLEMLPKICALAFPFSTVRIQRAALHSTQLASANCTVKRFGRCLRIVTVHWPLRTVKGNVLHSSYATKSHVRARKMKRCH